MTGLFRANLRTRLTVLYASLLGIALLLYAAGVSALFLHNLREQLDSSLDRDVETVEGALSAGANGALHISSREGEAEEDEPDRGFSWKSGQRMANCFTAANNCMIKRLARCPEKVAVLSGASHRIQYGFLRGCGCVQSVAFITWGITAQSQFGWPSARDLSGASFGRW